MPVIIIDTEEEVGVVLLAPPARLAEAAVLRPLTAVLANKWSRKR